MTDKTITLPEPNASSPQDPETVVEQIIAVYGLCRETLTKQSFTQKTKAGVDNQVREALRKIGRVVGDIGFSVAYIALFSTLVEYAERMMVEVEKGEVKAREELAKEKEE